jgi:hypothetical protein
MFSISELPNSPADDALNVSRAPMTMAFEIPMLSSYRQLSGWAWKSHQLLLLIGT